MTLHVCAELAQVFPSERIVTKRDACGAFATDESGVRGAEPVAIVRPKDLTELQALIRKARELKLPLQPVSSGPPHFRGDTVPFGPSVIVDMRSFNHIVRVDRRNRVAMFEAGVTFGELIEATKKQGLRPMMPLCPRANKSALAAYLEREPTIYPRYQWDISDPLLCIELVFGTGDIFHTGGAAGPGSIEEQWEAKDAQKNPMGPGQNDFGKIVQGAQGSIGIASWVTAKCEPLPTIERFGMLSSKALDSLVEASYRLLRRFIVDVCFIVDKNGLAALLGSDDRDYHRVLEHSAPWILIYSIAGFRHYPKDKVRLNQTEVSQIADDCGVRLLRVPPLGSFRELGTLVCHPSRESFWKLRPQGGMREVFFLTTMDKAPKLVSLFERRAKAAGLQRSDVSVYLQPLVGGRSCHLELIVSYDPHDEIARRRVQKLADEAPAWLMAAGAFFSRPYGAHTEAVMASASGHHLMRRVKQVFDPDRILSPGRLSL